MVIGNSALSASLLKSYICIMLTTLKKRYLYYSGEGMSTSSMSSIVVNEMEEVREDEATRIDEVNVDLARFASFKECGWLCHEPCTHSLVRQSKFESMVLT
ncbi:hypothetical protein FRB91_004148 [Serendipita sp. 411]|nr:hypothetical protein FRB91_004148 [Serendipita sp. 411]